MADGGVDNGSGVGLPQFVTPFPNIDNQIAYSTTGGSSWVNSNPAASTCAAGTLSQSIIPLVTPLSFQERVNYIMLIMLKIPRKPQESRQVLPMFNLQRLAELLGILLYKYLDLAQVALLNLGYAQIQLIVQT